MVAMTIHPLVDNVEETLVDTAIDIFVPTAVTIFVIALHIRFWRARYRVVLGADSTHYATTEDGWRLALHRYQGGDGEPIVLCHGLGANAFNMDLGPANSLARHLERLGHDVWSVDLRGSGASRRRGPGVAGNFTFDTHVHRDVPAIIQLVLSATGHKGLHWAGHSMGGLLMYAYLGTTTDTRVLSLCTIASPGGFEHVGWIRRMGLLMRFFGGLGLIPLRTIAAACIPLYWSWPISLVVIDGRHCETKVIRRAMANLVERPSRGVFRQTSLWLVAGRFLSSDGEIDYLNKIKRIRIPICFISGAADELAPPQDVRTAYDTVSSQIKELHVLDRASGSAMDYGHGDLVASKHAPNEVYPLVSSWLAKQSSAETSAERIKPIRHVEVPSSSSSRPHKPVPIVPVRRPSLAAIHSRRNRRPPNPYDPYERRRRGLLRKGPGPSSGSGFGT